MTFIKASSGPTATLPGPVGATWAIEPGFIVTWTATDGSSFEEVGDVRSGPHSRVAIRDVGGGNLRFVTDEELHELIGRPERVTLDW
jgi:hypothetical protein